MFSTEALWIALIVLLLFLAQRFFPRRRIFAIFCVVLLCAGAAFFLTHREKTEPMTPAERDHVAEQQMIVADWHAEFQGLIEQMDHNWRQYHRILSDFNEDVIDLTTTHERLNELEDSNRVIMRALMALLSHEISGNSDEKLKASLDEIQKFLIEK